MVQFRECPRRDGRPQVERAPRLVSVRRVGAGSALRQPPTGKRLQDERRRASVRVAEIAAAYSCAPPSARKANRASGRRERRRARGGRPCACGADATSASVPSAQVRTLAFTPSALERARRVPLRLWRRCGRHLRAFGAGSAYALRPAKKRQSRVDGQVCPSTRLFMIRPPARSPYETSTNRRGMRLGTSSHLQAPSCGRRFRPSAIGAGFVRLAAGRTYPRPAGARGSPAGRSPPLLAKNPVLSGVESPMPVKNSVLSG